MVVVVVVVAVSGCGNGGGHQLYTLLLSLCAAASLETKSTRYQVLEIINHFYRHQLTSSNSTSKSLLLVVGVAVVVVMGIYMSMLSLLSVSNSIWYVPGTVSYTHLTLPTILLV